MKQYNFSVDADTREIVIEEEPIIVKGDVNITEYVFSIPKVIHGIDMSEYSWRVWYTISDGSKVKRHFHTLTATSSGDNVSLSWVHDGDVAKTAGVLSFALSALETGENDVVTEKWNSLAYTMRVYPTVGGGVYTLTDPEQEIISDLVAEMQQARDTVVPLAEQVAEDAETASQAKDTAVSASTSAVTANTQAQAAAQTASDAKDYVSEILENIDWVYGMVLDGTNTERTFRQWWDVALEAQTTKDRYALLERFFKMCAYARSDKTYTLRYGLPSTDSPVMTPMDDLVGKTQAKCYTETTTVEDEWLDEDPMGGWYIRANALSLADGTMNVLAIEGEDDFDVTGTTAPVYTFALALCVRKWSDGSYQYKSWKTIPDGDYVPYAGDVAPDGTRRYLTWHPTYPGGLNGTKLTSGSGIKPYIYVSTNNGLTSARNQTAYEGLWNDADTIFVLDMWQLRHWNLENSNIAEGCTNYNFQYVNRVAETGVKRVLLSTSEGANLVVGSTVSIGNPGTSTNYDRGQAHMYNIADRVRITSIETVTVSGTNYSAVYVDADETFDTTTTTRISTMPYHSGFTDQLPSHKDGCPRNLTNGRTPLRVMGVEVIDGAYSTGLDPLYRVTAGSDSTHWDYAIYECKDSTKLSGSVTGNYVDTGIDFDMPQSWQYVRDFNGTNKAVLFPSVLGGSSAVRYKSAFNGTNSAGVRCPFRWGRLDSGGVAGLACEYGSTAPSNSLWNVRPRLCGSGKKRGEWAS